MSAGFRPAMVLSRASTDCWGVSSIDRMAGLSSLALLQGPVMTELVYKGIEFRVCLDPIPRNS